MAATTIGPWPAGDEPAAAASSAAEGEAAVDRSLPRGGGLEVLAWLHRGWLPRSIARRLTIAHVVAHTPY